MIFNYAPLSTDRLREIYTQLLTLGRPHSHIGLVQTLGLFVGDCAFAWRKMTQKKESWRLQAQRSGTFQRNLRSVSRPGLLIQQCLLGTYCRPDVVPSSGNKAIHKTVVQ